MPDDPYRCPVCKANPGLLTLGPCAVDYMVCDTCRLRWCVQVGGYRDYDQHPLSEWEQRAAEYPEIE